MDKILVAVFNDEHQANDGVRALKELHTEGSITLYGQAVIVRDISGKAAVKEVKDRGPSGAVVKLVTSRLINMLGGPQEAGEGIYDSAHLIVGTDFLEDVTHNLKPGKAAVVAEIWEEEEMPVDSRLEAEGGKVFRRALRDLVDTHLERDIVAIKAELAVLQSEYKQATKDNKSKLQAKIDTTKAQLQKTQDRAKDWVETTQREGESKMSSVKEQASKASAEHKEQLKKRLTEVRAEYKKRTIKLKKASKLVKEALTR